MSTTTCILKDGSTCETLCGKRIGRNAAFSSAAETVLALQEGTKLVPCRGCCAEIVLKGLTALLEKDNNQ